MTTVLTAVVTEESHCLDIPRLRTALSTGQFADPDETSRALAHFALPCRACWKHLTALTTDTSEINLEALVHHAAKTLHELPVALALGRLVLVSRQPDSAATLPPTHRYLLQETAWERSFEFWWLLIEEARRLALGSSERQIERWQAMEDALTRHSCEGPSFDLELQFLIGAYRADDIRFDGGLLKAGGILANIWTQSDRCRPEIRATIYELIADLHRVGIRDFSKSLKFLARAEAALQDVQIPGRLAETRMRIGLSRLAQKDFEPAFATFGEALELIPQGTDPRLRCEILLHMAAIKIQVDRLGEMRPFLEEADPFFESHASDLMRVQKDWLWSHVYLDEGELDHAERLLIKALVGFQGFGASKVEALANLVQFYFRSRNMPQLDRVLHQLLTALRQPGTNPGLADEIQQMLDRAPPNIRELLAWAKTWIH